MLQGPAAVIARPWPDALALERKLKSIGFDSVELRNAVLKNWLRTPQKNGDANTCKHFFAETDLRSSEGFLYAQSCSGSAQDDLLASSPTYFLQAGRTLGVCFCISITTPHRR